jgi:hypothetical protein
MNSLFETIKTYISKASKSIVKTKPYSIVFVPAKVTIAEDEFCNEGIREKRVRFASRQDLADYLEQYKAPELEPKINIEDYVNKHKVYPVIIKEKSPYETIVGLNVLPKIKGVKYEI